MEEIQLNNLQENIYRIIESVIRSHQSVLVSDKGKTLVKITPAAQYGQGSWLGCMRGKGKIKGDIIAPAEDAENWKVLSDEFLQPPISLRHPLPGVRQGSLKRSNRFAGTDYYH